MKPIQSIRGDTSASIAASVERAVTDGQLPPGQVLPSIRALANHLEVANGTAARAYGHLRDRGVVVTDGRRGTRIRRRSVLSPRRHMGPLVPPDAVDLSGGDPGGQPDPTAALAAAATAATGYPTDRNPFEVADLLDHLCARAVGDGIDASHAMVVAGTMYGIELALSTHLRPGDRVAVEDPGWADHFDLLGALGLEVVPVPVDDRGMAVDGLAAVVDRVAAVLVTPRAQNPTGAAMTPDRRDHLARLLSDRDVLLIEDDHAADIAGVDLHALAAVVPVPRWIMVRSMSKAWGPDLRLAAVFGDRGTIDRMTGRLRLGPGWVSRWLQVAALHLLTSPAACADVAGNQRAQAVRRRWLVDALAVHGVTGHGTSGVNVWIPVPDETAVVAGLLSQGWAVAPGARFRHDTGPAIRVTVAGLVDSDLANTFAADLARIVHHRGIARP